jgi:hypothetical protein
VILPPDKNNLQIEINLSKTGQFDEPTDWTKGVQSKSISSFI